jgi:hypothetical protein
MIRTAGIRWRILLVAASIVAGPCYATQAVPPTAAKQAFPHPGKYFNGWCSLELHADATFKMKNSHCPYPDDLGGPNSIVFGATSELEWTSGRLRIFGVDYLPLYCRGGVRFLDPDELPRFALSLHSADPLHLRSDRGFVPETAPVVDECDLSPLPSALRRIAEADPISATIVAIQNSECAGAPDDVSCDTTVVLDRGEAHGLVDDIHLYFPQCPGMDYAMSVEEAGALTATANILWSPRKGERGPWLVGESLTTRMPACLVQERERFEREASKETP